MASWSIVVVSDAQAAPAAEPGANRRCLVQVQVGPFNIQLRREAGDPLPPVNVLLNVNVSVPVNEVADFAYSNHCGACIALWRLVVANYFAWGTFTFRSKFTKALPSGGAPTPSRRV